VEKGEKGGMRCREGWSIRSIRKEGSMGKEV
jgi:hypothetical protein